MDDVIIHTLEQPHLNKPILVEGLPGIGLVGKLAGDHLKDQIKAIKFAEITSPYKPTQVIIKDDGTLRLVNMEFYYHAFNDPAKNDIILLLGDFQGITPDSQYQLTEKTLDYVQTLGVHKIFTLGGLGTGHITTSPTVFGAATNAHLKKEVEEAGVVFRGGGIIFGASGLLLGLGMRRNIEAICLMGETHGQIIDAKSAEAVLEVLARLIKVPVDMTELKKKAKETESQIAKISQMMAANQMEGRQQDYPDDSTVSYIR
ncbi:PAC2 family protein [uncultured archaeon]|nr:PAC2 family protein [uncultured archaeon]